MNAKSSKTSGSKNPLVAASVAASWVTLVAATALGVAAPQLVRAQVSADPRELAKVQSSPGEYRLIVQSYAPGSVIDGVPRSRARPLASTQRAVTAAELARGIGIDVVDFEHSTSDDQVIVAWLERGTADLDYDALRARPKSGAYLGVAAASSESGAGRAEVVLSRRLG
jgi:hypothetical protein